MNTRNWSDVGPEEVLAFWFPDDGHDQAPESHRDFWVWRMRGGADEDICEKFTELTAAAARGHLDHWTRTPRGKLALIIVLDQFSRSVWRGKPTAYAQDLKATRMAFEALERGEFHDLPVWEQQFCAIAISHCEGPDHLQRMDRLVEDARRIVASAPKHLQELYKISVEQAETVRDIIAKYGRHPHRNEILGRESSDAEAAYIANGVFPHERKLKDDPDDQDDRDQSRSSA